MPTPIDIKYTTPDFPSPCSIKSCLSIRPQVERWTPTPVVDSLKKQPQRVAWSGYTNTNIEIIHRGGHSFEDGEDWNEAGVQFEDALAGCQFLLSPTHKYTKQLTYHLAQFYAKHDRMKDADTLLDWMSDSIVSQAGITNEDFTRHLLKIAELLRQWRRIEEAKIFGMAVVDLVYASQYEPERLVAATSTRVPHINYPKPSLSKTQPAGDTQDFFLPLDNPILMDSQLSLAMTYVEANKAGVEKSLLALIKKCEEEPQRLAAQLLEATSALVELYERLGDPINFDEALKKTKDFLWKFSIQDYQSLVYLPQVAVETAKVHAKYGRHDSAVAMFGKIESDVAKAFGEDDDRLISLLISNGIWFHDQDRWRDGRPRFEQALSAALGKHDKGCELIRRLERTLEDRCHAPYPKWPCVCFGQMYEEQWPCRLWTSTLPRPTWVISAESYGS